MFVVFDLDGTLADCTHRLHHIQLPETPEHDWPGQDWQAFNAATIDDSPITPFHEVAQALIAAGHRVEIWTGRSDHSRADTEAWLTTHGLAGVPVRMRPGSDNTADHRLKVQWLAAHGRPDLIFEDRARVVKMWRDEGIICAQVAPGDF